MSSESKIILCVILVVLASPFIMWRLQYPYGARPCYLPCTLDALQRYAEANQGAFPDAETPYAALQKLHPEFLSDAEILAGLSGDRKVAALVDKSGGTLTSNECSWVYHQGLTLSAPPETILIYERSIGVGAGGWRSVGSRAVGLVQGSMRQMPEAEFQKLMRQQQAGSK